MLEGLKSGLTFMRLPLYIIVSSGAGAIAGTAIANVKVEKAGLFGQTGIYLGAWALQSLASTKAAQHADGMIVSFISQIEMLETAIAKAEEDAKAKPAEEAA